MKVLQLQTELLALQNKQKASEVAGVKPEKIEAEKQGLTWASVAAKPQTQTKVLGEKEVNLLPPVSPDRSGEEADQSSKPDAEQPAIPTPVPAAVAGASPPNLKTQGPPAPGGSKKEAKNATNSSKGGNKGRSRRSKARP